MLGRVVQCCWPGRLGSTQPQRVWETAAFEALAASVGASDGSRRSSLLLAKRIHAGDARIHTVAAAAAAAYADANYRGRCSGVSWFILWRCSSHLRARLLELTPVKPNFDCRLITPGEHSNCGNQQNRLIQAPMRRPWPSIRLRKAGSAWNFVRAVHGFRRRVNVTIWRLDHPSLVFHSRYEKSHPLRWFVWFPSRLPLLSADSMWHLPLAIYGHYIQLFWKSTRNIGETKSEWQIRLFHYNSMKECWWVLTEIER